MEEQEERERTAAFKSLHQIGTRLMVDCREIKPPEKKRSVTSTLVCLTGLSHTDR